MAGFDFLASLPAIAPEVGLTILAIIILFLDVYLSGERRRNIAWVTVLGLLLLAATPLVWVPPADPASQLVWGGMVRHDTLAQIFRVMILLGAALTALMSIDTKAHGRQGEFYLILVVATLGACLVSAAADLVMVFLGLETLSIPLYILAAFRRDDLRSAESGMKYFLFGAFASALMLFGLSILYGFSGQTSIYALAEVLPAASGEAVLPVLAALTLVVVGFGFKIGAAPFHFWTPDMYEGAPTPVTAFVSVASKAASFALLVRFLIAVFPQSLVVGGHEIQAFWVSLAALMAVISMTLGNVLALSQRNIKRLLAYSSIAQAGYALIGVAAIQSQTEQGVASVGFYLFMYTFTNLLAFAVVVFFSEATGSETIADLAGLNRRSPWLALMMTIALLSLGGIPPTAGFFGKFFLFNAAVQADLTWLAIVGVLNAIIALYYYLIVIKVMYVDRSADEDQPIALSRASGWALALPGLVVLLLGTVAAQPVFEWAVQGALALFQA
ncbi:MAG: NADH-quinone oxidoreductase subunit N [Anaerolineaceae bacterium]|nr:NADH-quinone oxidoreductase subunit N [Anaerolineaceae bacterium]MDE0329141.1 NADH-quinone oxidoreductase subunit N [Anaerolineaceae bacterium]